VLGHQGFSCSRSGTTAGHRNASQAIFWKLPLRAAVAAEARDTVSSTDDLDGMLLRDQHRLAPCLAPEHDRGPIAIMRLAL
jgi:hypothetical protein